MKNKIIKAIKNPKKIVLYLAHKGIFNWMDDKTYLKFMYKIKMNEELDLDNPKTFNQKLQWLKLNDRQLIYNKFVDKYAVRKYISDIIGEEYLIPLIGVYDTFDEIVPDKFVLKCTHDSGGIVICTNKQNFNKKEAKKKLEKCMKRNFYYIWREWPYKDLKPRIICEKYMEDKISRDLKDYKFMCFNGEVKCLFVCLNRGSKNGLNVDFYDLEWNKMPFEKIHPQSNQIIDKPATFEKMVKLAKKLSKDIPFIRVDFYEVNGKVYFGELTLYPDAGVEAFKPYSYDELLGSWITLSQKNNEENK